MAFQIRTEGRPAAAGLDGTVYILEGPAGGDRAEVWPALGFNCFRWLARKNGQALDLLYSDPQLFDNPVPTRSGVPILFPFPNRIKDGRYGWFGRSYQLPRNDPAKKNAIHGYACRNPWRVVGQGADESAAWLTGEFQASVDAPAARGFWPADYRLRITYRLAAGRLRIEAAVENPDAELLPFGLGFHPYFRVPFGAGGADDTTVQAAAGAYWVLADSLPTGSVRPVDPPRDLRSPRSVGELTLDDVLTGLEAVADPADAALLLRGRVRSRTGPPELRLSTSGDFRELVVFTPPHRHAVCLEPYTGATDAINLQARGVDAGLKALPPGGHWSGVVQMEVGGI